MNAVSGHHPACHLAPPSPPHITASGLLPHEVPGPRPLCAIWTATNPPACLFAAQSDLLSILELPVLVVLDEAYIEFSSEPSRLAWVANRHNLVVLRTFSKSAGGVMGVRSRGLLYGSPGRGRAVAKGGL